MRKVFCIAVLLPQSATAQMTDSEMEILPRLVDHACLELRDDWIGCEEVVLLADRAAGTADLIIAPNGVADSEAAPIIYRSIAFNGAAFGQRPTLSEGANGSFKLTSEQIGIGRSPWDMTLSIAWRDEIFVLAGVTYATWDRLSANSFACDVNLRTGGYELRPNDARQTGSGAPRHLPLTDWSADSPLPAPCAEALSDWWQD